MVFAKLWLLGILAAVLVLAATPPSSAPVVVRNEIPAQDQPSAAPAVQPCQDTATAQIAASEERLVSRVESTRQDLQSTRQDLEARLAESSASAASLAERVAQLERRLATAEDVAAAQGAEVREVRGAVAAPIAMTWLLTGLAGAGAVGVAVVAARKWKAGRP